MLTYADVCEQYMGTLGGGMDQAASFMSVAGHALLLRFTPLRATCVQVCWRMLTYADVC
jgi:galactokinase